MSYYKNSKIKQQFSPKLRTYRTPTLNQRKGRTLQTTPYMIQNTKHQELMSQEKLEQMKKILIKYNKLVDTSFILNSFFYYSSNLVPPKTIADLGTINRYTIQEMVEPYISTLPILPDEYKYYVELTRVIYMHPSDHVETPQSTFTLTWATELLTIHSTNILVKNGRPIDPVLACFNPVPYDSNTIINQRGFCPGSMQQFVFVQEILYTSDPSVSDDILYPFISTNPGQETYDGSLTLTYNHVETEHTDLMQLKFTIYPGPRPQQ